MLSRADAVVTGSCNCEARDGRGASRGGSSHRDQAGSCLDFPLTQPRSKTLVYMGTFQPNKNVETLARVACTTCPDTTPAVCYRESARRSPGGTSRRRSRGVLCGDDGVATKIPRCRWKPLRWSACVGTRLPVSPDRGEAAGVLSLALAGIRCFYHHHGSCCPSTSAIPMPLLRGRGEGLEAPTEC
jgi:hypothetical protein